MKVQRALEEHLEQLSDVPNMPATFDLGVLFVHGIGEQQRGDTLTEAGDVLAEWLRRWLDATRGGRLDVLHVALHAPPEPNHDPVRGAHAILRIRQLGGDPAQPERTWLLAESWWADTFRAASFSEFAAWGLGVGPWVASSQLRGILGQAAVDSRTNALLIPGLWVALGLLIAAGFLVAAALSLFFFALALALFALRLVPIGPIQGAASAIQRTMALGFGDAFALVRSPLRFGAMKTQVRADLRVLRSRCRQVAVVAHSQGTTIAWAVLMNPEVDVGRVPDEVSLFVTYGQAMRKLKLLRVLHTAGWTREAAWDLIAVIALLVGLVATIALGVAWVAGGREPIHAAGILLALGLAVGAQWQLLRRAEVIDQRAATDLVEEYAYATREAAHFEWLDLWASADPLPNGPLLPAGTVASYRIHNLGSAISDHSVYWQNLTEFVSAVLGRLARLGGVGLGPAPEDPDPEPLERGAAIRRRIRAALLSATRGALGAGAAATLLAFADAVRSLGGQALCVVNALPLVDLRLRDCAAPAGLAFAADLAGAILVAVGFTAGYVVALLAWRSAVRGDDRGALREAAGEGREVLWPLRWIAYAALIAIVATLVAGAAWIGADRFDVALGYAAIVSAAAAVPLALMRGGFQTLDGAPPTTEGELLGPVVATALAVSIAAVALAAGDRLVAGGLIGLVVVSLVVEAVRQLRRLGGRYRVGLEGRP